MRYRKLSAIVLFSSFFAISFYVSAKPKSDRQQVIDHIHSIFQAFVREDTTAIRAKHTEDWRGFQSNSREIVKGVDGYMQNPIRNLSRIKMLEYEIEDIEVQLYGNIAIVYYVAQWKSLQKRTGQKFRIRARSIDIYRKDANGWNQAGSHLSILPSPSGQGNPDCLKCVDIELVNE